MYQNKSFKRWEQFAINMIVNTNTEQQHKNRQQTHQDKQQTNGQIAKYKITTKTTQIINSFDLAKFYLKLFK